MIAPTEFLSDDSMTVESMTVMYKQMHGIRQARNYAV